MNNITYTQIGDYLIPDLSAQAETYNIGKYGMLHKSYIKQNHPGLYLVMMINGTLLSHVAEVDKKANIELERLMRDMAAKEGVTEELKATDQMEWVRMMNSIKHSAEEIILKEIIYTI
ncbi:MAG: TnpV protein [Oscillospiraceae bacterium]|nr:TnpV protein [Oscillospiraceae bacterium]